jgi:exopolysaccharide biosynthesis polyprenyl glycosylphosphotransferase
MKTYFTRHRSLLYLWTDIFLLNFSYFITYRIYVADPAAFGHESYLNLFLISNLLWVMCVNAFQIYAPTDSNNDYNRFWKLVLTITAHLLILEALNYLSGGATGIKESWIFSSYQIFTVLSLITHVATTLIQRYVSKAGINLKKYVIVGNGDLSELVKRFYGKQHELGYSFGGAFNFDRVTQDRVTPDRVTADRVTPDRVTPDRVSHLDKLENFIEAEKPDFIYCALAEMDKDQVRGVIRLAERKNTHVRLVPDYPGFLSNKLNIEALDNFPIINVQTKAHANTDDQFVKRAFDILFSSIVMIMGFPIFLLVMLAVKVSSKGNVFFLQERTGRWGKKFKIIKFRTMYSDAHKYGLQHSLGAKDPRITTIGNFLRRTRLDELPQFLNVMKGEMSIVGPRPLHKYDVDMLMTEASHEFQKVLTIRPGITSIGQIKVGYASTMAENLLRLKYDMLYLNTYSLTTDLYLIVLTIQVILLGKGK